MFWQVVDHPKKTAYISICAGTLDQPCGLDTTRALFTFDAADYHTLDPSVEARDDT